MTNYLKSLLEYFVDETPLDALQMQALVDNGLVEGQEWPYNGKDVVCYTLTEKGKEQLKGKSYV